MCKYSVARSPRDSGRGEEFFYEPHHALVEGICLTVSRRGMDGIEVFGVVEGHWVLCRRLDGNIALWRFMGCLEF